MIRVLMIGGEYPPHVGGVGDYTARLCQALAPREVEVAVLTSGTERQPDDGAGREHPQWVARMVPSWGLGSYPRVVAAARAFRADVVHLQYQAGAYQLSGATNLLPLWLRARLPRVRVAVTFHDLRPPYLFPKAGPLRAAIVRLMANASHGVVCTEPHDLRQLGEKPGRRHIPLASNIDCAPPPGFEPRAWREARGLPATGPLVGFFGFMNATKGVDTVLRALALLPEAHLALIGGESGDNNPLDHAEARRVRELEQSLDVARRVWRSGPLPAEEVSAALLGCDVLALPFSDGASARRGTLLAALVHGCAIVTTRGPDDALLTAGHNAVLIDPGDHQALAAELRTLMADQPRRIQLGDGARQLAARYAWPAIAREHEAWYAELVGIRASP